MEVEIVGYSFCRVFVCLITVQPSPKVAVLRFERGMQQGLLARISRSSIMEYHAFGIISHVHSPKMSSSTLSLILLIFREGKKSDRHFLICGVQGDFTRNLVDNPPKYIWTRQLKVKRAFNIFLRRDINLNENLFSVPVRWGFEYILLIQSGNPNLYRYRSWRCVINMSSGEHLVF